MSDELYPGWKYQPLFDLMSEHGLTLLQDEMYEIIKVVRLMDNVKSFEEKE